MNEVNQRPILATDLDGTLIPLTGNSQNIADLKMLRQQIENIGIELVFVTGRHLESVESAIEQFDLPQPDWIVCDVGSSVYQNSNRGWQPVSKYQTELRDALGCKSMRSFHEHFDEHDLLRLQEPEKQTDFKMSFYADGKNLGLAKSSLTDELVRLRINGSIIASVDPFNGDGLLDVLPTGVSKQFALDWWLNHLNFDREQVAFAGDSGNDFAAMTAGYKTIVVGNADAELVQQVTKFHATQDWEGRLHVSKQQATSGVLDGIRTFEFLPT